MKVFSIASHNATMMTLPKGPAVVLSCTTEEAQALLGWVEKEVTVTEVTRKPRTEEALSFEIGDRVSCTFSGDYGRVVKTPPGSFSEGNEVWVDWGSGEPSYSDSVELVHVGEQP